jgi:putative ABC transport system ATP-binding protein
MLRLEKICKTYRSSEVQTCEINQVSLTAAARERVAIMGLSGCGKSTLLNVLRLLDSPDAGECGFSAAEVAQRPEGELTRLRRTGVGFIFLSFHLAA